MRPLEIAVIRCYEQKNGMENLYYLSVYTGLQRYCKAKNIVISNYFYDEWKEILPEGFDGIIALGKFDREQAEFLSRRHDKIVFVDSSPDEDRFDAVIIDYERAVGKVLDYLLNAGHRAIGLIAQRPAVEFSVMGIHECVYRTYMERMNLLNESYIYLCDYEIKNSYSLMKQAIQDHGGNLPTAFFIADDEMAAGALRALAEEKIPVPDRVNVVGFYGYYIAKYTTPALTTMNVFPDLMGQEALNLLVERINGRKVAKKITIATKLVKRESSF